LKRNKSKEELTKGGQAKKARRSKGTVTPTKEQNKKKKGKKNRRKTKTKTHREETGRQKQENETGRRAKARHSHGTSYVGPAQHQETRQTDGRRNARAEPS
jgi:hypothetical protein